MGEKVRVNQEENTMRIKLGEAVSLKRLFNYANIARNLSFLLFLSALALFYIWNSHSSNRIMVELGEMQKELIEYNWEFTTITSELNHVSRQSEVASMVKKLGLEELRVPPKKIEIKNNEY